MKPQEAVSNLRYEGVASGSRQTYHVFRGRRHFLVLSFKREDPTAGNFNIIAATAVAYAESKYRGAKRITAKQVLSDARRTRHFKDRFAALNTLYVLVALGKATVSRPGKPGSLLFSFPRIAAA
jgi:hypothetical protein